MSADQTVDGAGAGGGGGGRRGRGGGGGGGEPDDPATTPDCTDVAVTEPTGLLAVTATRIVEPTSAELRAYEPPVAPDTATQLPPALSQRFH